MYQELHKPNHTYHKDHSDYDPIASCRPSFLCTIYTTECINRSFLLTLLLNIAYMVLTDGTAATLPAADFESATLNRYIWTI